MMRFGANLLTGIGLSKLIGDPAGIATYETAILVFGLLSFAPINAIVHNFLAAYAQAPAHRKPAALRNSFQFAVLTGLAAAIIGASIVLFFYGFSLLLTLFFALFVLFNFLCMLTEYDMMLERKLFSLLLYGGFSFFLRLVVVVVPVYLGYGFTTVFMLLAIVTGGQFGVFLGFRRKTPMRLSKLQMRYQFAKIQPLFVKQIIGGGVPYINGILVTIFMTDRDFVLFRYAARDFPLVPTLMIGVFSAVSAQFATGGQPKDDLQTFADLRKSTRRMMRIAFPVTMVLVLVSYWLMGTMYNSEFVVAAPIFNLFLLLTIPRMLLPQAYLAGKQLNHLLLRVSVWELILHLILATLLIQFYGLYGIILSAIIAYSLDRGMLMWYVAQRGYGLRQVIDIGEWLAWSVALIALVLLANFAGWHLPADTTFW